MLAIDPGTREFGLAVFSGAFLQEASVKSLRRTRSKRPRLAVLARVLTKLITNEAPAAIALVVDTSSHTPKHPNLLLIVREMQRIAHQHEIPVFAFAPATIKHTVTDNAGATKRMVARALCAQYPQLCVHFGHKDEWRERYALNMFDAVACGLTYRHFAVAGQLQTYAVAH